MKKIWFSTLLTAALSFNAHADYISPQASISSQAAHYSVMDIKSLSQAAKEKQPVALFVLATKYETGKNVEPDIKKAFALYQASADQGLSPAQYRTGLMLINGQGISKNEVLGRQYLEKAALKADNRASYRLALLEEQNQNYMSAYQWYELAAVEGAADNRVVPLAESKKLALAANLTQDQIRTARDQAYRTFSEK